MADGADCANTLYVVGIFPPQKIIPRYAPMSINGLNPASTDDHDAVVPLVVRYFPVLPDCEGSPSTEDVVTPVIKPLELTVITGMAVDDP